MRERRRRVLAALAGTGASSLAGCTGLLDEGTETAEQQETPDDRTPDTSPTETDGEPALSVVESTADATEIPALDPVLVSAVVRNDGDADGETTATLVVDDERRRSRPVHVPAGEERHVEFAVRFPATGAYAVGIDGTDTTVEVTEPERALPAFNAPAETLDTTDASDPVKRLLVTTLQGVVNARTPRILVEVGSDWALTQGIDLTRHDFWELVERYSHEPACIVVYDPSWSHTINAATTIAGVERAIVASPEQRDRLVELGLDVLVDLRELEHSDTHSLYRWLFDEYWEQTAEHVVVGLPPGDGGAAGANPHWQFRDYAVATKAMTVWLDPEQEDEASLLSEITSAASTPGAYLGWWSDEVAGVTLASENGVFTGAADYMESPTVWSGTAPHDPTELPSHRPDSESPDLDDAIYVTFTISEGDNLQYCQNRMKDSWGQFARGEVPINWSISPLLADIAPGILSHYVETATEADQFVCGPTGIGYAYPKDWPDETLQEFTELTGRYLDELRIDTLYALNRLGIDSTLSPATVAAFESDTDIDGIALGWDGPETTVRGDDLVVSNGIGGIGGGSSTDDVLEEIEESIPAEWDGDRPLFRSVGLFGFEMGPREVETIARQLGPEYEVVRGDVFFELARQAARS